MESKWTRCLISLWAICVINWQLSFEWIYLKWKAAIVHLFIFATCLYLPNYFRKWIRNFVCVCIDYSMTCCVFDSIFIWRQWGCIMYFIEVQYCTEHTVPAAILWLAIKPYLELMFFWMLLCARSVWLIPACFGSRLKSVQMVWSLMAGESEWTTPLPRGRTHLLLEYIWADRHSECDLIPFSLSFPKWLLWWTLICVDVN